MWTAEENSRERHVGERRKLELDCEAQMCRVKSDRASRIFDLISDTMHGLDERVP